MRILIDTNIFIPLEDSGKELQGKIAQLSRLASGKHQLLIHSASYEDLERDSDTQRRQRMLERLKKYVPLESPPEFGDGEEEALFGQPRKPNDTVDNLILFALHSNCAHWLITEDRGIHKKSKAIGEYERVLTVDQAIISLSKLDAVDLEVHPHIEDVPCHTLNLDNPLFDSLREGYEGFDAWFNRQSQEGRHAWISHSGDEIHSICIYKQEEDEIVTCDNRALAGKLLKLCTFKVVKHGYKLGELMLKQAFKFAASNGISHVYLTVEPGQHLELNSLLADFGFQRYGKDRKGRDDVYEKPFCGTPPNTNDAELDYAIRYYPAVKFSTNTAFLVPIQPQFHKILFPENQPQIDLFATSSNSAGNAIKQAYLCKAPHKSIKPGDLLFFYRTQDHKAITTYGVVDQFVIENEAEKIYQWVAKRTVYSYEEIQEMAGAEVKIILFRLVAHLDCPVTYQELQRRGIVKGPIQSITSLSNDNARTLIQIADIHDCFIPN